MPATTHLDDGSPDLGYKLHDEQDGFGPVFTPCGPWQDAFTRVVRESSIRSIRLSRSAGWRSSDGFAFVEELGPLRSIEIYDHDARGLEFIERQTQLEELGLQCARSVRVSCRHLSALRRLFFSYSLAHDFEDCTSLEYLNVNGWRGEDLHSLARLARLQRLFIGSRTLRTVSGVEELHALRELNLLGCRALESVECLRDRESLEILSIDGSSRIESIEPIGALTSLVRLKLDNCGAVKSLAPIAKCRRLTKLSFLGSTNVLDGDLSPLLGLEHLEVVACQNRRHYKPTRKELVRQLRSSTT